MNDLRIHAIWTAEHQLFLHAESHATSAISARLPSILFVWHKRSFYGTTLQLSEYRGYTGIFLTAVEAVEYFADASLMNQTVHLKWIPNLSILQGLAKIIQTAHREQKFLPDFSAWKRGEKTWKLASDLEQQAEAILAEQSDFSSDRWSLTELTQWLQKSFELDGTVSNLESLTLSDANALISPHRFHHEEDWLRAIGFAPVTCAFTVGLELLEPPSDNQETAVELEPNRDVWTLQIVLRDRENDHLVYPLPHPDASTQGACPAEWLPEITEEVQATLRVWRVLCPDLTWTTPHETQYPVCEPLDGNAAWRFLIEDTPVLLAAGFPILAPNWWNELRQLRAKVQAKVRSASRGKSSSSSQSLFSIHQTVAFDWRIALGDVEMDEAEFERLVLQKQRLLRFKGRWVAIDPNFVRHLRKTTDAFRRKEGVPFREALEMYLLGATAHETRGENDEDELATNPSGDETEAAQERLPFQIILDDFLHGMVQSLQHIDKLPILDVPSEFQGTLRPYQKLGYSWLVFLRMYGLGACLADDMGLGKTVQFIAYLLYVKSHRTSDDLAPTILICPTSLLGNWQKELERFAPNLKVHVHYGTHRGQGKEFASAIHGSDVVLTTYNLAQLDETTLQSMEWDVLCLDEAQNIKNPQTKQAIAVRGLPAQHRIAMTGTPVENRLSELWSLFEFMNPGYLGGLTTFTSRFARPIERDRDEVKTRQIQQLTAPFLLRRTKQDPAVAIDLPEKLEMKVYVNLGQEQTALYETVVSDMLQKLDSLSPMERRGLILASLTRLKQICNHPALFSKLPNVEYGIGQSTKLDRLLTMVAEARDEGDACIVFTQFVETGRLLQSVLENELNESVGFLHGGLTKTARDNQVAAFQVEQQRRVLILSLKAGGVGLNLTAANHVFHFDRWWNPAVENQATDRAYRIGQTRHVQVHKFVALGTLEERIDEMIEQKRAVSEQVVGTGEQWITELSTDELRDLFQLRRSLEVDGDMS